MWQELGAIYELRALSFTEFTQIENADKVLRVYTDLDKYE